MIWRTVFRAALPAVLTFSAVTAALAGNGRFTQIGPEGGSIPVLRVDPVTPRVVYAGAGLGGLFKSTDGGDSWRRLAVAPANRDQRVLDLVLDPADTSTLYVAFGGTVWKSRDAGATFANAGAGIETYQVFGLAIDPRTPAVLYAATYTGLYKTHDGGGSWQLASPDLAGLFLSSIAIDPRAPQTLFAGVEGFDRSGVFKSTDGGATWVQKTNGVPASGFGGTVQVVVDPAVAGRVFATFVLYGSSAPAAKSYRSTDNGESWAEMTEAGVYPLTAGPGNRVLAGSRRSTDGGETWAATSMPGAPLASHAFDPAAPQVIYAGSASRGVARSTDGGQTWREINQGLWATEVAGLAVNPKAPGALFAGVVGERLWAKPLAGGPFQLRASASAPFPLAFHGLEADPTTPRILYVMHGGSPGTLLKSTDGGRTYTSQRLPTPFLLCYSFVDLVVDPTSPRHLYGGGYPHADRCDPGCDTFKSTDGGATWTCMNGLPQLFRAYVHPLAPANVFALADAGLYRSTDRGESWRALRTHFIDQGFQSLAFDPQNPNLLYAGADGGNPSLGIWRSKNGGSTWMRWSRGFSLPVAELIVDPRSPDVLYAGVGWIDATGPEQAGVYRSADGGLTWRKIPGLADDLFNGLLAFDPIRGTLYAGTIGQGVFAATMR